MKYALQEYKSFTPWIEHEIIALLQKLDWEQEKRSERSCTGVYTLVQKEDKHFLYNGRCTICLDNEASEAEVITCKEIEEGESSNSLTT